MVWRDVRGFSDVTADDKQRLTIVIRGLGADSSPIAYDQRALLLVDD